MTATLDDTTPQLEAFRDEVHAWLEANAKRRRHDTSEFKQRVSATSQSRDDELEHVEACKDWQRKIHDAGFAGIAVPTEYGGRGGTPAEAAHLPAGGGARTRSTPASSPSASRWSCPPCSRYGTEEQKLAHIPAMLRGENVWCQLFSEPGAGSDLAGLTTRAELDGESWIVNGQKVWNSFAHVAEWGILLARTDWDVPKHRGITYFLVDMRSEGVDVRPLRQITGVAHFNETFLTDVHIPAENVVGEVNGGWGVTQVTLMSERVLIGGWHGPRLPRLRGAGAPLRQDR